MSRFNATGLLSNRTVLPLTLKNASLSWGSWIQPPMPSIAPGQQNVPAFVATGSVFSGTQGQVVYQLGKDILVTLCFDDPFSGSNSTNGTMSSAPDYVVSGLVPSHGSTVTFAYVIAKVG